MATTNTRAALKNLTPVGVAAFVIVTILTLLARIVAVSAAGVATLADLLTDAGEAARADLTDRVPPPAVVVTAVRTRDVPAWSMR